MKNKTLKQIIKDACGEEVLRRMEKHCIFPEDELTPEDGLTSEDRLTPKDVDMLPLEDMLTPEDGLTPENGLTNKTQGGSMENKTIEIKSSFSERLYSFLRHPLAFWLGGVLDGIIMTLLFQYFVK